jgi:hypothetical protein
MNRILKACSLWLLMALSMQAEAQRRDSSIFALPIQIDEVIITAAQSGWDLEEFIRRVKSDTTFYDAFRALRFSSYTAVNDISMLDKKGKTTASLHSTTRQTYADGCRSMEVLEEKTTGNFYKRNGDYRYYTAALYAYLFFTQGKVCGEQRYGGSAEQKAAEAKGKLEKSKAQLKQLIFSPGSKVSGVPFMGDRASVFDPQIARMYRFMLLAVSYEGEPCYLFQAVPKPEYANDVVFSELSTWFRETDYSIMARDYVLSFRTLLYDFDVRMKVRLQPVNGRLLPASISYDGNWHVATQSRERARFTAVFSY